MAVADIRAYETAQYHLQCGGESSFPCPQIPELHFNPLLHSCFNVGS